MKITPYGRQSISREDIEAVSNALKSDYLTTGGRVEEFEKKFAEYVGSKYAVAVSNGTAALHLACLASGLKSGDELITTPITFAASANCALYCNAKPVFVDVTKNGLINEDLIEKKITKNTKIIIPVHYAGMPCNMSRIREIADKHKLIIIEDACHALGAKYKDTMIGDCAFSDMSVFSFHPVKHITTGEGGMITTNSIELYKKLRILRSHGITRDSSNNDEPWRQDMITLGFNYRITDFQCALGTSQLERIDNFVKRRREIARIYDEGFEKNPNITILNSKKESYNSYHLYVIKLNKKTRQELFNHLKENGVFCQVHYLPVYLHSYYKSLGYKKGLCPESENFYDQILSIPIFVDLEKSEQARIIKLINNFVD